jgi:hypothetical protein
MLPTTRKKLREKREEIGAEYPLAIAMALKEELGDPGRQSRGSPDGQARAKERFRIGWPAYAARADHTWWPWQSIAPLFTLPICP